MKVAVVILPKNSETNFSAEQPAPPLRVFVFSRATQIVAGCAMVGCAMLLIALTCISTLAFSGARPSRATLFTNPAAMIKQEVVNRETGAHEQAMEPAMMSEKLRRGDTVVLNHKGALGARQVATSNECVIVKRDNAVQGLYLLGEGSYLVVSDKESKVVRAGTALVSAKR